MISRILSIGTCLDPPHIQTVIKEASKRARSKQARYVLQACGRNGKDARSALWIYREYRGIWKTWKTFHADDQKGLRGGTGGRGFDGEKGGEGGRGSDVNLILSGAADELSVSGSKAFTAHLGGCGDEGVLLIDNNRGSKGGIGGEGGVGGVGGEVEEEVSLQIV